VIGKPGVGGEKQADDLGGDQAGLVGGVESFAAWHGPGTTYGGEEYGRAIDALREFLAAFAGARPGQSAIIALMRDLEKWTEDLKRVAVAEPDQVYARRVDLVGRGQASWPPVTFAAAGQGALEGIVRFGRFFLGRNGVAHGGAVALVFDEFVGRLAHTDGRPVARTAFLKVDYRAPTPIDTDLRISARITREEGRKRFLAVQLRHGDLLCAEAEALMVTLKPGQQ